MTTTTENRRTELLALLGREAERLATGEGWQHWLDIAGHMREYSLNNQLLIAAQHPGATHVAGFRAWQALGRQVRKGERGIAILAPLVRHKETEDESDDRVRVIKGFRIVHVFDISQTDGPALPSGEFPAVRVPDLRLRDQLIVSARRAGFEVKLVPDDGSGARGWFAWRTNTISVIETNPVPSQIRTLLHELAHACDPDVRKPDADRSVLELVAESAAYLVGRDLGLDMDDASTFYVMTWGADQARLLGVATSVLAVARAVDQLTAQLPLPGLTA